ncbi:MAG TPA: aspartate--tRNA(Asn) ligase [archaeon]|nr:aspartate--tRNA(Asn) ligase [archaeon]
MPKAKLQKSPEIKKKITAMPQPNFEGIGDWQRTHYSADISPEMDGKQAVVMGWVRELRDLGKVKFISLADREGKAQILFKEGETKTELIKKIESVGREWIVAVKGTVKANKSAPNGFEILPIEIKIINESEPQLPLEPITKKTPAEFETRLGARFIDLRKPEVAAIFKVKDMVTTAVRNYLEGNNFIEIHSPKIIAEASEGGSEVFAVSYFDREAFLAQSPQFYKQMMMATGFDRVYEIAPAFRAEKSHTTRHVTEILMLDIEMAFINGLEDVMKTMEGMMHAACKHVSEQGSEELKILGKKIEVPKIPFPRISMSEAKKLLLKERGMKYGEDDELDSAGEKALGEIVKEKFKSDFVFLTEFPWKLAKFYHKQSEKNPAAAERCDLIYKGLEITTAAQREHRYWKLMEQARTQKVTTEKIKFYLDSFRYGMPPHGGSGTGVDRIVQQMLELANVQEAILFPRTPERLTP